MTKDTEMFEETDLEKAAENARTHAEIAVAALKRDASPGILKIAKQHLEDALNALKQNV